MKIRVMLGSPVVALGLHRRRTVRGAGRSGGHRLRQGAQPGRLHASTMERSADGDLEHPGLLRRLDQRTGRL